MNKRWINNWWTINDNQWTINNHGCYDDGAITCQEVVKKSQVSKWSQEVQIKKYCLRAIYVPALFAIVTICKHYLPLYQYEDGANTCPSENQASQEVQIKKYCLRAIYVPALFASIICHCNLRAGTICQHYLPFYLMLHHCLLTLTWCAYVPHDQPLHHRERQHATGPMQYDEYRQFLQQRELLNEVQITLVLIKLAVQTK